jgi:YVTN family beta-propeller protein
VVILDAATRRGVNRIDIGHGAAGIQMQPDGSRVYVSCTPDNYVIVMDLASLKIVGHIDAGKEPDGLAWAIQR